MNNELITLLQSYLDVKIVLFIIFYTIKANKRIIQKYCKLLFLLHAPHVSQLSLIWLIYCHTTLVPSPQSPDNIKNIYCRIIINTIYNINTILLLTSTMYYVPTTYILSSKTLYFTGKCLSVFT